jgi:hypothetical protein
MERAQTLIGAAWVIEYFRGKMDFVDFISVDFSPRQDVGFVYILSYVDGDKEVPFYVGETQSIWGRLNDYHWAEFQASTDFRVGEAVKYLTTRSLRVVAKYKLSAERKNDERNIINALRMEGWALLNDRRGYDYRKTTAEAQRLKVKEYVEDLLGAVQR